MKLCLYTLSGSKKWSCSNSRTSSAVEVAEYLGKWGTEGSDHTACMRRLIMTYSIR